MKHASLVEKEFKIKFGLKLCLVTIIAMLAMTIFIFFATAKNLGGSYRTAIYTIYDLKVHIFPLMFASFYTIFILVVVSVAIGAIALFFSHKMAGPIFRLERSLEAVGKGDLTVQTKLRTGDQLTELADEINLMVKSLGQRAAHMSETLGEMEEYEERLRELLSGAEPDEGRIAGAVEALRARVEDYKRFAGSVKARD